MVLHPGAHTGSGEDAGILRIAEALDQIHAEDTSVADTLTLLELTAGQGTTLGCSFEQLAAIIEKVTDDNRVGVCIDTCHALAAGYDLRNEDGYEAMMTTIVDTIGLDRVKCWHFNDSVFGLGSRKDRHAHIGEGEIGLAGFGFILNDPRWDGVPMLLETPKDNDGDGNDARNLAKLASLVEDQTRLCEGLRV
ncbi:MAG: deoxyribonuclease IV [Caldilineaceae bacterium]